MTKKVPDSEPAVIDDGYAGQGGSYLLDPATGQRVLQERTAESGDAVPVDMTKELENGTTEA